MRPAGFEGVSGFDARCVHVLRRTCPAGDGPLKLLLPLRFGETTWMAAAWKILSEVGSEGLPVTEVGEEVASFLWWHGPGCDCQLLNTHSIRCTS